MFTEHRRKDLYKKLVEEKAIDPSDDTGSEILKRVKRHVFPIVIGTIFSFCGILFEYFQI